VTDDLGGKHVAYRQNLVGPAGTAEIFGSEVILHYDDSGALWAIGGTQFTTVSLSSGSEISSGMRTSHSQPIRGEISSMS
jgi:hypothetical protein